MSENKSEQEITFYDLVYFTLKHIRFLILFPLIASVFCVLYCIISIKLPADVSPMPNVYTAQALVIINQTNSSTNTLSATSGLGDLAAIAGVKLPSGVSPMIMLAQNFFVTNEFADQIIDRFDLVSRYKIKKYPKTNSRKELKKHLSAKYEASSGLFIITCVETDPEFAKAIVNYSVEAMEKMFLNLGVDKNLLEKKILEENIQNTYNQVNLLQDKIRDLESSVSSGIGVNDIPAIMNETKLLKLELASQEAVYTQLKSQHELLKIKMGSETPVFQVLERAEAPDKKTGPSRAYFCVKMFIVFCFLAFVIAFILDWLSTLKNNPELRQMLKLGKIND